MKKEFVIWGIAPNTKDEQPLYTRAANMLQAVKVLRKLEKEYGCSNCRIQVIDFNELPDFTKTIN